MANASLAAMLRRREALVERAAAQRAAVAAIADQWHRPLAWFNRGIGLLRALSRRPDLIALAVMFLVRARHGRLAVWLGRAATAWQWYRALRRR